MKKNIIKKVLTAGVFLFGAGYITGASAHVTPEHDLYSGFSDSPVQYGATDVWQTTCSGGSDRLVFRILDTEAGRSNVSAQAYKDGKAANTVDLLGGDSTSSAFVKVASGDGVYTMIVSQSLPGFNFYILEYHCENANGGHTTTTQVFDPIQDQ